MNTYKVRVRSETITDYLVTAETGEEARRIIEKYDEKDLKDLPQIEIDSYWGVDDYCIAEK